MNNQTEIESVIEFMLSAHKGQKRKATGLPYAVHPIDVLSFLSLELKVNSITCWKAAVAHDILEDCPTVSFETLKSKIGEDSAAIVQDLTFVPNEKSVVPSRLQKEEYIRSFCSKSVESLVIKIADRICNTNDFLLTNPDYAPKYWKQADFLFEQVDVRKDEIVEKFGHSTYFQLIYCIERMKDLLK